MPRPSYADVYAHQGPFVTVYLDTESAVPQAAQRFETRWRDARRDLEAQGVDAATLDAMTAAAGDDAHLRGATLVMVASHGQVHLVRHLPDAPRQQVVNVGALPHLLPLIDWPRLRPAHVLVLVDREGADVLGYGEGTTHPIARDVDAEHHPVHKTGTGGWSALRYEHKVEEGWKASAKQVAEAVVAATREVGTQLVIVAGDVHARGDLAAALPEHLRDHLITVSGSRQTDGSEAATAAEVGEVLQARVEREAHDVLGRFGAYLGREGKVARGASTGASDTPPALKAADGPEQTLAALREGRVETLIITDAVDPEATAAFGPEPMQVAATTAELSELGVEAAEQGLLVDVVLRAALAGDADVIVVSGDVAEAPHGGVGGLLRY
jgi:hypothetical protein